MTWERKLMRTVLCQNDQKLGTLARLVEAIADAPAVAEKAMEQGLARAEYVPYVGD